MAGIVVAGTVLVDRINLIQRYPAIGELVKIEGSKKAVGGCVPNVAIDLKTLSPSLEVTAIGRIGKDDDGAFLIRELSRRGVNCKLKACGLPTGFTEVMSVQGGERTFFTCNGANGEFGAEDIDFGHIQANRLHLGYLLLLDRVDRGDGEKILREAKRRGMRTSVDLVSNGGDPDGIKRCLPLVDDLIVNELEAAMLAGTDGDLFEHTELLKRMGVIDRVIVHEPKRAVCVSSRGQTEKPSLLLPEGYIKGATGAGDAFTAGALLGIEQGLGDEEILSVATYAAAASLGEEDAVSGMKNIEELRKTMKQYERQ